MFFKALGYYILQECKNIKNHFFGILSVLVKYVGPLVFIFSQSIVSLETKTTIEAWVMPVLAFIILFYFFAFRKALKGKKIEEKIVKRLDSKKAAPLRIILFSVLDDCIMAPLLPFLFYQLCKTLERLSIQNSTCFLILTILFIVGGILKVIDLLIDLTRTYEESSAGEEK